MTSISARATSMPLREAIPYARCTSAVLIKISTLPPISAAVCCTDPDR